MLLSLPTAPSYPRARRLVPTVLLAAGVLGACTPAPAPAPAPAPPPGPVTGTVAPKPPVDTLPEVPTGRESWQECPYLDTAWVEQTNGQRVTGVGLDERFSTPACVYWSYPDAPQLRVLVRELPTQADAIAAVDHFAPPERTELAELPGGWSGGRGAADADSGVFAVFRDNIAVIVLSNQAQSFKAEQVAEEAIANLGL